MISADADERWQAYAQTHIEVFSSRFSYLTVTTAPLGVTEGPFVDHPAMPLYVITAHNPGRLVSDEDNAWAHRLLGEELQPLGAFPIRLARGYSPDGTHCELSYIVGGISRQEALDVAAEFGQEAIFVWTVDRLEIVATDGSRTDAYGWVSREGPFAPAGSDLGDQP
jgi:hypothetical protein